MAAVSAFSPSSASPEAEGAAHFAWLRVLCCAMGLALLAGCASSNGPQASAPQAAAQYRAHARGDYPAPGPAGDPWGPYISEAAQRFDVPERWVREVMRAESGGDVMSTSGPGAMGLMQLMPENYEEARGRYDLGGDPYDPHDNIIAGAGDLRQLYDAYGFPGFLAAYNAGPGRLEDYLYRNRPLPQETRNYVRKIAPRIADVSPARPSAAAGLAMNQLPMDIPAGPRYPRAPRYGAQAPVMLAENRGRPVPVGAVQQTPLVVPPVPPPAAPSRMALAVPPQTPARMALATPPQPPAAERGSFHLIPQAMADTMPASRAALLGGAWGIQVGAFANEAQARSAAEAARGEARELAHARPTVGAVQSGHGTLYRARLTGLSRDGANAACDRIGRSRGCMVLSPDSQS